MKIKIYSIVVVFLMLLSNGCSKDDSIELLDPEIVFVNEDGSNIIEDECVNSTDKFALKITLKSKNRGVFIPTIINYTLNGVPKSITFTKLGTMTIPVTLINGQNSAQLSESGYITSVNIMFCNAKIIANKIGFVFADGSEIPEGECLDLSSSYAVKIETEKEGTGDLESTEIEYTLNGVVYSTTFTEITSKLLPVTLSEGENIAQLIASGSNDALNVVLSCNAKIIANKIGFVFANGSEIPNGGCLDFNKEYAVFIEVLVEGNGNIVPTEIEYTLNGVLYKMVFNEEGGKLNAINIKEGQNVVQIVGTDLESTIYFTAQGDFELVE